MFGLKLEIIFFKFYYLLFSIHPGNVSSRALRYKSHGVGVSQGQWHGESSWEYAELN